VTTQPRTVIPIYSSRGDAEAFLAYPYIFSRQGEWIGWVTPEREVYSVLGSYIGYLSNDPRILRKRSMDESKPLKTPPARPGRINAPATVPLPRMMKELSYDTIDIFEDYPELLHTLDSGELKQDMD
jgi:hypothetical protein